MKWIKGITILCFCFLLILPIAYFNSEPNVVSEIDNRKLAENPFTTDMEGDLTDNIENYVNDRIGFRDEMILGYTVLNDRLFGKMVHPSYKYGKDGYVFGEGLGQISYGEYHEAFVGMVEQLQTYCEERNIPFLMVFNPAKPGVLTEYLPEGMYYNRDWVDQLLAALDEKGIHYVDNTETLTEKHLAGEVVFNQKYDANHWNDLGAYYGVTAALSQLAKEMPTVHVTSMGELKISEKLQSTLPVSKFPIEEYVPSISVNMAYNNLTAKFKDELELHPSFKTIGYYVNAKRQAEGAPRALVFQGSYMNTFGSKYMINAFGEYVHIHDYQNVINFDYYFNIFQPECVVFEVAEYTLSNHYFNLVNMQNMQLNPSLTRLEAQAEKKLFDTLQANALSVKKGETLTTITWKTTEDHTYVWLRGGQDYDFRSCEGGYEVTLKTEDYQAIQNDFEIVTFNQTSNTLVYRAVQP